MLKRELINNHIFGCINNMLNIIKNKKLISNNANLCLNKK